MDTLLHLGMPGLYGGCYVLMLLSAVFPWVNGEAAILSLSVIAGSQVNLALLAIVGTAGQMTGKCVMYWMGRRAAEMPWPALKHALDGWRPRLSRRGPAVPGLLLASATFGIPPFYATSVAAGALRISFAAFVSLGTCGRLLHFGGLIWLPHLLMRHPW